jgi:hypothetical protein
LKSKMETTTTTSWKYAKISTDKTPFTYRNKIISIGDLGW